MRKKSLSRYIVLFVFCLGLLIIAIIYPIENYTISSLFISLLSIGFGFVARNIYEIIISSRLQFSGFYRDEIFSLENPQVIIKRDKFCLNEKDGSILSGSFMRYVPEKNKLTNWKCSGFIVLDQFLLAYRAENDTTPSRGVILVKLDTTRANGLLPCYKGKYFKFEGEKIIAHEINLIKISKDEYNRL